MATTRIFGDELAALMADQEVSGRELARRTRVLNPGGGTISHYTKGYIYPEYEMIERVARALGVSPNHFAEYRLETVRRSLDYHAPRKQMPGGRQRYLDAALEAALELGLDL